MRETKERYIEQEREKENKRARKQERKKEKEVVREMVFLNLLIITLHSLSHHICFVFYVPKTLEN